MNWEETIKFIRTQEYYRDLVKAAYFEEDLPLNIERFRNSSEFAETLSLLKQFAPDAKTILDIGSGNGISAISFALAGYQVTVSEPDPSETIGAGAVRKLKEIYKLENMDVHEDFAENIGFPENHFDIVYVRQAMHHAYDLQKFVKNLSTSLKPGGLLLTIRDHVIFNEEDKKWFLESHPLQKFYGGENAFTPMEYRKALEGAGLEIRLMLKHFDSVINYFPLTENDLQERIQIREKELDNALQKKIPVISNLAFVKKIYRGIKGYNRAELLNERSIPGRMYSFIAIKGK